LISVITIAHQRDHIQMSASAVDQRDAFEAEELTQAIQSVDWFYSNARGLRQAAGELRQQLSQLRPTFFGLTETHLKGDAIRPLIPSGYKVAARLDRSVHGGGLLIGAKSHLLVDVLDLQCYNTVEEAELIGISYNSVDYLLCYTPNSHKALKLIQRIENYRLDHPDRQVVFIGDFNVHEPDWIISATPADAAGIEARDFCEMYGLYQLVGFPTRGDNTLDLVMSTLVGSASPLPNLGTSDHKSMLVTLQVGSAVPESPVSHLVFVWATAPWGHIKAAFRDKLKYWDPRAYDTVDAAELALDGIITSIIQNYIKKKKVAAKLPAPWWNTLCTSKFKYKCKQFNLLERQLISKEEFDLAVKLSRKVQKIAYARYQQKLRKKLASMSKCDRNFWSLTKEISGLDRERSSAAPDVDEIADHFAEKMSNGKDKEDVNWRPTATYHKVPLTSFKIRFKTVLKTLLSLDPSKSSNGIGPRVLKECAVELAPALTKLYKFIVQKAVFPTRWKVGRVTPLHKRDAVSNPKNYRPVTVLDNNSTCFESSVDDQFYKWISKFIPEYQYGFLRDCGTIDYGALLAFKIQSVLEARGQGILIVLDVKGAFDRCWWARLKKRFQAAGMRGKALELIKSYLLERFIQVVSNGSKSTEREIYSGVPQGAIWSPKIWDFDISEMHTAVSDLADIGCYADDIWLWYEITDHNKGIIIDVINQDLSNLVLWGLDNKTTFEPDKTFGVFYSRRKGANRFDDSHLLDLEMEDCQVEFKPEVKITGFVFDDKLSWGSMIDVLAAKARKRLGAVNRLKRYLDSDNLKTMYTMFVRSIMEYGGILFMGASDSHLAKLDKIQSAAERIGGFLCEPLKLRREAAAVSLALKMLNGDCRKDLDQFKFLVTDTPCCHRYNTKAAKAGIQLELAEQSKYPLAGFSRGFLGALPLIWAKLPHKLIRRGSEFGWRKITAGCKRFIKNGYSG
jgi:hypothetical protein